MSIVSFFFLSLSFLLHDLHMSISDVKYNSEYQRLEIQHRIFIDDLENTLKLQIQNPAFNILDKNDKTTNLDSLLTDYLNLKTMILVDGKRINIQLLEYEHNTDAFTFYMYANDIPEFKNFKYSSHILFELFDDQNNIVSININGKKKSGRFRNESDMLELTF